VNLTRHRVAHRAALAGVAAAGLLLTGCGSSLGVHPGSAVKVGDASVSMDKIDTTSTLFCKVYVAQQKTASAQQQSGPIPLGSFRSYAASSLAKRALGQQLADQYSVQPASGYAAQVSQYQQALASTPADQRDAAIVVAGADAYLQNVEVSVGQQLTGSTGQSTAELKADLERGQVAAQDWLNDHDAFVDPVFGLAVDGGNFTAKKDQTSYPLSALASQGAQAQPAQTYTESLPTAQVCG
jgi:hypothetical protein